MLGILEVNAMRLQFALSIAAGLVLASGTGCSGSSDDDDDGDGDADADADADTDADADADGDADGDADLAFDRFRLSNSAGPCMDGEDCSGYVELSDTGQLLVDKFGEVPESVHEAQVTDEELTAAIVVLTDPDLVALLDLGAPPCKPPTDIYESMELELDGVSHQNSTTFCGDAPLEAARDVMHDLQQIYVP